MNGEIHYHIKNQHKYLKGKKYFENQFLYPFKNTERLNWENSYLIIFMN